MNTRILRMFTVVFCSRNATPKELTMQVAASTWEEALKVALHYRPAFGERIVSITEHDYDLVTVVGQEKVEESPIT